MEERDMPKADFVTAIVLIAFAVAVVWMSAHMPAFENRGANPLSAPGIVPGILGVIIGFLGLILLIRSLRHGGNRVGLSREKLVSFVRKDSTNRFSLTILLALIYAWGLVGKISFPVATFIFVAAFIVIFEYDKGKALRGNRRTIVIALLEAVLTAAVVSAVFRYLFLVNLP